MRWEKTGGRIPGRAPAAVVGAGVPSPATTTAWGAVAVSPRYGGASERAWDASA
jgi:hypothetical protein